MMVKWREPEVARGAPWPRVPRGVDTEDRPAGREQGGTVSPVCTGVRSKLTAFLLGSGGNGRWGLPKALLSH